MLKKYLRKLFPHRVWEAGRVLVRGCTTTGCLWFDYDKRRFYKYAACTNGVGRECTRAKIIANYHVVEKGLTMPNRRMGFGKEIIRVLMQQIEEFEGKYGVGDQQVDSAIGVLKEYFCLHRGVRRTLEPEICEMLDEMNAFLKCRDRITALPQMHVTREMFYSKVHADFLSFAKSRHTVRNYSSEEVPISEIMAAVDIARSTPSACNRQHCRVYCISDILTMKKILTLQGGCRGFGHLANKVLVVTANLQDAIWMGEHRDNAVNGGMFLMNLCYSLHYKRIAHCILTWARSPDDDKAIRKLLPIRASDNIVALITCGYAPNEFDVATSPRKPIEEYFVNVDGEFSG